MVQYKFLLTHYYHYQKHYHSHHHPITGQTPSTIFPTKFPGRLDDRYRALQSTSTSLRLYWNSFVTTPPFFGPHLDSNRLHNWALNNLKNRHDIHKNIQEDSIQMISKQSLIFKLKLIINLNSLVNHPLPLSPPDIAAQFLSFHFLTTEFIYKYERYTKKTIVFIKTLRDIQKRL